MRKIGKYMAKVLMAVCALALVACHGQSDEEVVPEGVLRIFADKTTIAADGSDVVTFKVMFGSEDVSTARTMQLVRSTEGAAERVMDYGVNTFSTLIPASYTFKAEFYRSGQRYYTDNEVEIVAVSSVADGETKPWAQKILGFQFTSVGCVNCPLLSSNLKLVQENFEDRMVVASFHKDFNASDPMKHTSTELYYKLLKTSGLPQFCPNMIVEDEFIIVNEYEKIVAAMDRVEQEYPATCGVAIESSMVEDGGSAVKVKAKITSNTPTAYRYQVFLVEDGIVAYQEGAGSDYVHNNVVRGALFGTAFGEKFNEGANLQVGVEATAERTLQIPAGCNIENMRVIVAAMVSYDGGNSFVVNNCAECPVGESVDYAIKTVE